MRQLDGVFQRSCLYALHTWTKSLNWAGSEWGVCVWERLSRVPLFATPWIRLLCPWNSPGKNTGVGCHSLLQRIFLTQESNPDLLDCRQILYPLSRQGSPKWGVREDTKKRRVKDLLDGTVDRNLPAKAGDMSLIPGLGRSHMLWSN